MMIPKNTALYESVKKEADAKFLAKTSIYKSAWIVRAYKKRGGAFKEEVPKDENKGLLRWFREKWVDLNRPGQPCGRSSSKAKAKGTKDDVYPLCRPTIKVTKETPKLAKDIGRKDIARANKEKQKVRHKGRIAFSVSPVTTKTKKNKSP